MPPGDVYARFFETAQSGMLLLEKDTGRILEVNAAFLRMAGRRCSEVVGRSVWKLPLVADAEAGSEIHEQMLAGGTITGVELPLQAGDVPSAFACVDFLEKLTGYRPLTSIATGVEAFVKWHRSYYDQ